MIKELAFTPKILLFSALLIVASCRTIEVNKGPFTIPSFPERIAEKEAYLSSIANQSDTKQYPNVLIILADDLGKHDISIYDSSGVPVPNIQSLADAGVLFTNAFTSSPVCSPSRAALFTGRYQQRYGFERQPMNRYSRNRLEYFFVDRFLNVEPMRLKQPMADVPGSEIKKQGIPAEEILLSELFQHAGYQTALCGKWHLGNDEQFIPNRRGFDFHYGFYEAFTLYAEENTKGIIEHRHDYFANKHIWRQQRKTSSAIRVNDSIVEENEYLTFAIARESVKFLEENKRNPFFLVSAFSAPHTPFQVPEEYFNRFPEIEDHNKRVYYGMISALDDAIGMILRKLADLQLDRNTLIFFASDNGGARYTDATDNGPLTGGKFTQFEGGINIPMIISYPSLLKSGSRYAKQVALLDIFSTALGEAGIDAFDRNEIDGVNLVEKIRDPDENPHEYLYWRTEYNKAIRSSKWKMIWNTRDEQLFLYDISAGNQEIYNQAEAYPDVVKELLEVYEKWENQMSEPLWPGVMEYRFEEHGIETWWAI